MHKATKQATGVCVNWRDGKRKQVSIFERQSGAMLHASTSNQRNRVLPIHPVLVRDT
mgnify:CR=1 FL=1